MAKQMDLAGGRGGRVWRIVVWGAAGLALLTPLVAMRFTDEVAWTAFDFVIFGAMLTVAGGAFELAVRMTGSLAYRAGAGVALAGAFLLVWINIAVGVIGSEDNPANLMYAGVLAVGIIGAIIARFQPEGMARAMTATALAQGLVAAIALIALGDVRAFVLTGVFAALWLAAAWLFRVAARDRLP